MCTPITPMANMSTCFYSASAISNIRIFFQWQIVLQSSNKCKVLRKLNRNFFLYKTFFAPQKTVTLLLLIYTNREKEFRAKIFIVIQREVAEVQKVGFASSSRNPLSVSTTDLRLKDKCRGNTLALLV